MATESDVRLLPLLATLETLGLMARHLDPMEFDALMEAVGRPDDVLRATCMNFKDRSGAPDTGSKQIEASCRAALAAFDGLRAARDQGGDLSAIFKALRHYPQAQEALYPLAATNPAINRFFLDPAVRSDPDVIERSARQSGEKNTGIFHDRNDLNERGGFSIYVPEFYTADRTWPLVIALHGGSGHGRTFLWSWLREARSFGAVVVAPTANGRTWALMGEDTDTQNLKRMLASVRERWTIDSSQMLMTGMSDGGTFCYVSGLEPDSPFTHLAPVAATFHPLMAAMADADRLRDLPIHIVHGALDWMFPVEVARQTQRTLAAAGANMTYREIDDLSHCYPREVNAVLLAWMAGTRR